MADQALNTDAKKALADMSDARVADRAEKDYPRHFWSAAKDGHYRFALAGIAVSLPISAAIGTAVAAAVSWPLAPIIIPAYMAAGALMAIDSFGAAGAAAASRASGLAEKHARQLDGDYSGKSNLKALDDNLMESGRSHNYEFTPNGEKKGGKVFSLKSGLAGAGAGAALGALLGIGGTHIGAAAVLAPAVAHVPLIASLAGAVAAAPAIAVLAPMVAFAAAGALAVGMFGLSFGIERKVLKSTFNELDAATRGNIIHKDGVDLGRVQSHESDYALTQHRLRRQADIDLLEKEYTKKISWGALSGRMRGFMGAVPGVIAGLAAGALVVAMLPALSVAAAALTVSLFSAGGGLIGMKVFSEAGTEAGAEATARGIDNEFERNRELRARGITPPAPKKAKENWLNLKAGAIMTVIGAAVGAAMTLAMAPALLAIIPAAAHLTAGGLAGVAAITGGGIGASYGLGNKSIKAMAKPFTSIYDKMISNRNDSQRPADEPAMQQPAPKPAPVATCETITPEEAALLNERLATTQTKNFTQLAQQMQATPATLSTGV